jgi:hypothetical protein
MTTQHHNAKGSSKRRPKEVDISLGGGRKMRHFHFVHRRHTGKLLHHRHTSHLALVCILAITGLFIFATQDVIQAAPQVVSHDVNVTMTVPGPPPTIGATITSPSNGATFEYQSIVQINGACEIGTIVIVSTNGTAVGSTSCTGAGIFTLSVQLPLGVNALTAKDYDGLNQAGPDTPTVTVAVTSTSIPGTPTPPHLTYPVLPSNPFILDPFPTDCDDYTPPTLVSSATPGVAIICIPRTVVPKQEYSLGVFIWGGTPPYALNIDWGDDTMEDTLISVSGPGYQTIHFNYATPGLHTLTITLKDKDGNPAFVQAVTVVNGKAQPAFVGITDRIFRTSWVDSPVPFYLLAVAVTLGFWAGDLFDRRFGISRHYRHLRKLAKE